MSLEVLRDVKHANKRHSEEDTDLQRRLAEANAETPHAPVGAGSGGLDTATLPAGRRR